jgi:iron complex outermembrane receptor protein
MTLPKTALYGAAASFVLCASSMSNAFAAETGGIETVVVTAQKVQENINDVGMSIQAASGDQLLKLGIADPSDLVKIVPGFNYSPSFYGTPIYAIRGVSFQDTSLAASPAVSVNADEVPMPYSIMTTAASLDVQRVEVLKGPQGTLFGENATGGAINFIANKPSDDWEAGASFGYGRFNTVDLQGFVGGPITDTLDFRVAGRLNQSGDWQYSYTHPATWGAKNLVEGRAALQWKPDDSFTALLTLSAFHDTSDTQMPSLFGIAVLSPVSGLDPRIGTFPFNQFGVLAGTHYPFAPADDRAADWGACVNTSPFDPPFDATPIGAERPLNSTSCAPARNDNTLFTANLRMDYYFGNDLVLTSLTSHQRFDRDQKIEGDGTIYQDYESWQRGYIDVTYEELRLAGKFGGEGQWLVGANYEKDTTYDHFLQTYGGSTANPTAIPGSALCPFFNNCLGINLAGVPVYYLTTLGPTEPTNREHTQGMAIFANAQYPITDQFTLQAGVRFTQTNKDSHGCGNDGGDGTWSHVSQQIQNLLEVLTGAITPAQYLQPGTPGGNGIDLGPGACSTSGPGPTFNPQPFLVRLDENNVSWRTGVNYKPWDNTLLYVNVSQGWKAGSFPTVATSAYTQLVPAKQEGLRAYEAGFKSTVFDNLQVNGAFFYYDYKDKQLLGAIIDPVFGPLPALVNVPKSSIIGFELSGVWQPFDGFTLSPMVSLQHSRVGGCTGSAGPGIPGCHSGHYFNFDPFSHLVDLSGEAFPTSPELQWDIDAEYDWHVWGDYTAFVGANANYQSGTNGFFYNRAAFTPADLAHSPNPFPPKVLNISPHTLLDLRAGVENDTWRFQVWGRNVMDEYYWVASAHVNDVLYRYNGMPVTYGFTLTYRMPK